MPEGTIEEAKRLIAAASPEGLRRLGAGVYRPCHQDRYNSAALAALEDPAADLTAEERRLIASFIALSSAEDDPRTYMLRVRLTESERERLERLAEEAGMDLSEYTRSRLFVDREE